MQYTATSFAEPVQRVFDDVLRPVRDVDVSHAAESRYVIESVTFHSRVDDRIERSPLRPGDQSGASLGSGRSPPPAGQRAPIPGVRPDGARCHARRRRGARMSGALHTAGVVGVSVLQVLVAGVGGLLLLGLMRKVRARLEGRVGAPIAQPLRDVRKLMRKERMRPDHATWIFPLAPVVLVATVAVAAAIAPLDHDAPRPEWRVGSLRGRLPPPAGLRVARARRAGRGNGVWRHGLEPCGHDRCAGRTGAAGHDPRPVGRDAHRPTSPRSSGPRWPVLASIVSPARLFALAALLVVIVAESGRLPVDNPATHLELTMIHEAMILEYAGPDLALVTVGEAMRLALLLGVFVNLLLAVGHRVGLGNRSGRARAGRGVRQGRGRSAASSRSSRSSWPSCGCSDSPSCSPGAFVLALLGVVSETGGQVSPVAYSSVARAQLRDRSAVRRGDAVAPLASGDRADPGRPGRRPGVRWRWSIGARQHDLGLDGRGRRSS